jgi:hypothetical protein
LDSSATGYWPVAGVDLSLLATAGLAIVAARELRQRERGQKATGADRPPTRAVVREAVNV